MSFLTHQRSVTRRCRLLRAESDSQSWNSTSDLRNLCTPYSRITTNPSDLEEWRWSRRRHCSVMTRWKRALFGYGTRNFRWRRYMSRCTPYYGRVRIDFVFPLPARSLPAEVMKVCKDVDPRWLIKIEGRKKSTNWYIIESGLLYYRMDELEPWMLCAKLLYVVNLVHLYSFIAKEIFQQISWRETLKKVLSTVL